MINLTKKTPYRRSDLVCTYNNEGEWIGWENEATRYDKQTGCFFFSILWSYTCVSGTVHSCTPGDRLSGFISDKDCD